jgi:hypothetical protein
MRVDDLFCCGLPGLSQGDRTDPSGDILVGEFGRSNEELLLFGGDSNTDLFFLAVFLGFPVWAEWHAYKVPTLPLQGK